MTQSSSKVAELRFQGGRYTTPSVDVDALQDIRVFMMLLQDQAIHFWKQQHPDRERVGRGFQDKHRVFFSGVREGSTRFDIEVLNADELLDAPLLGQRAAPHHLAADQIMRVMGAIKSGERLSSANDRGIAKRCTKLGRSLQSNESIAFGTATPGARVEVRSGFSDCAEQSLQTRRPSALKTLRGRVVAINMAQLTFTPVFDGVFEDAKEMALPENQAHLFIEALKHFTDELLSMRCRVEMGEDGSVEAVRDVLRIEINDQAQQGLIGTGRALSDLASGIREEHTGVSWDELPRDLSDRVDEAWDGGSISA